MSGRFITVLVVTLAATAGSALADSYSGQTAAPTKFGSNPAVTPLPATATCNPEHPFTAVFGCWCAPPVVAVVAKY